MKALIVSLESFQRGEIPPEVIKYLVAVSKEKEPFIILDESSKIKTNNPCKDSKKSKRTQAILKLGNLKADRCILTGTFMSKTPVNAYDQMNFLKPGFFSESMYAFAERYEIRRSLPSVRGARITITQKDYAEIRKKLLRNKDNPSALAGAKDGIHRYYGISYEDCDYIMQHEEYSPYKNVEDLWKRIGDSCIKVDRNYTVDMPPKTYKKISVELTKEQKKLYLELQNLHCTDNITVDNGLKLYLRFQDVCNGYEPVETGDEENKTVELNALSVNPKLDMLEEILDDLGDAQVVVWCSRTRLLYDAVERAKAMGLTCGIYDGKVKKEDRERDYNLFGEGKIQILFCNQASGAYGLNKLKECDYAIYLSNSYSVEQREQSEDRIYRGIVTRNKYIIDITCEGTCEDRVTEALKQGKELLSTGETDVSLFLYEGK